MKTVSDNPKIQRAAESFIDAVDNRVAEIVRLSATPIETRWYRQGYQRGAREGAETIAELVAVLEMIACLKHGSNPSAASLAKSALDTMRLLNDPTNRRTD